MTTKVPHGLALRPPGRITFGYVRLTRKDPELENSLYRMLDRYCLGKGYALGECLVDYDIAGDYVDVPRLDELVKTIEKSDAPCRVVVPGWDDLGARRETQDVVVEVFTAVGAEVECLEPSRGT